MGRTLQCCVGSWFLGCSTFAHLNWVSVNASVQPLGISWCLNLSTATFGLVWAVKRDHPRHLEKNLILLGSNWPIHRPQYIPCFSVFDGLYLFKSSQLKVSLHKPDHDKPKSSQPKKRYIGIVIQRTAINQYVHTLDWFGHPHSLDAVVCTLNYWNKKFLHGAMWLTHLGHQALRRIEECLYHLLYDLQRLMTSIQLVYWACISGACSDNQISTKWNTGIKTCFSEYTFLLVSAHLQQMRGGVVRASPPAQWQIHFTAHNIPACNAPCYDLAFVHKQLPPCCFLNVRHA